MRRPLPDAPALLPPPRLLAAARVLAGMSQRELAAAAGISLNSLARYEAELTAMRTDNLGAVVSVLRRQGIQFTGETRDAKLGLLLLKDSQKESAA